MQMSFAEDHNMIQAVAPEDAAVNDIGGTRNRSIEAMPSAWLRRKIFQPCDGRRHPQFPTTPATAPWLDRNSAVQ
jgi:hypothetical protein